MITVKVRRHEPTRYCSLTIEGHAGQADIGHDIICASASILAYTVAQIVKTMDRHGDLSGKPVIKLEDGNATIICRCKSSDIYAEAAHTFFVAQTGYLLLAHNYPEYVEIKTVGEA